MFELWAMQEEYATAYLNTLYNATVEEKAAAFSQFGEEPLPDILSIDGAEATISITGPLSANGPSPLARFFGFNGTAYNDIIAAAATVAKDPNVKTVNLAMDTPGGNVSGMDSARQAIELLSSSGKFVVAKNLGLMASAGYYLASPADRIIATNELALTGSIGVIAAGYDLSKLKERAGIKEVVVVSSNAPNKYADLSTKRGVSIYQDMVDAQERIFLEKVAQGRGVSVDTVKSDFGQGGVLQARDPASDKPDAVKAGMIDAVVTSAGVISGVFDTMHAGPTSFKDFPIVDRQWDSAAADRRVRDFVGATDGPNERYRQAFFWYDSENAENFEAYKLPFVDIVDGRMTAIWRGVSAAKGAMSGARGQQVQIPQADRARVQAHIDRYRQKWQDQNSGGSSAEGGGALSPEAKAAQGGGKTEGTIVDLKQLKADYPALYAEAIDQGKQEGVTAERERVSAHLKMGEASGDMKFAAECIENGKPLSADSVQAHYLAAGMKRREQGARAEESEGELKTAAEDVETVDKQLATVLGKRWGV